ncbi:hypothetical protein CHGG_04423 [Chaetomium globosum CBS 148.51]|uniref:NmrA-like domain-containing protein n=1 Tax=Chaetomium globosum (strain ATCC 6205 / CBS 148.51 / DSM 1962 / NBRC 6347 / NRRL 1970) TaxID=306901 RepID=Q2H1C3_CHAGB|nr:uncharacterized protein CHGG_04423 [Chaetomium globosum CBS 148.51]EAQ87804.1 hypothetical protein CHGG_04423 [Chaetomium globosum CBS 148.51]
MARNICITSIEGQTGFLIAELLLTDDRFQPRIDSLTGLALDPSSPKAKELQALGAVIAAHTPGRARDVVATLQKTACDTLCLVPPARSDKLDIALELAEAAKKAGVANVLLISAAGCDYAERAAQPRLREFVDLESVVLSAKGDPESALGIRLVAGFYAENLLLYSEQARNEGLLPLPIGENHKFAPIALGDVSLVAAHVLTGKGPHGFDDRHRGQLMVLTGPMLCSGKELAESASKALGQTMEFDNISEREAKRVLKSQTDLDDSEKEYILDYYSLVREGKTNYISTTAFHDVTGQHPTEPDEFFRNYAGELRPKKKLRSS